MENSSTIARCQEKSSRAFAFSRQPLATVPPDLPPEYFHRVLTLSKRLILIGSIKMFIRSLRPMDVHSRGYIRPPAFSHLLFISLSFLFLSDELYGATRLGADPSQAKLPGAATREAAAANSRFGRLSDSPDRCSDNKIIRPSVRSKVLQGEPSKI
jgi:hypothetical protein